MLISLMKYVLPHLATLLNSPLRSCHMEAAGGRDDWAVYKEGRNFTEVRGRPEKTQRQSVDYSPLSHPKQERLCEPPVMLKKSPATGGLSPPEPATQEVQDITNQVKLQLEVRVNRKYDIFRAILYRTQIVAGVMYFIKVQVADTEYVHLKVLLGLPPENVCPALVNFQTGKTRDDPLDYF